MGNRAVGGGIEYQVIAYLADGWIVALVIDDMISPQRAHHIDLWRATYTRYLAPKDFRDLYGEAPHAAGRAIDQHTLTSLYAANIPQALQSRQTSHRHRRRLCKREIGGLWGKPAR